jgi:hypothetical protein
VRDENRSRIRTQPFLINCYTRASCHCQHPPHGLINRDREFYAASTCPAGCGGCYSPRAAVDRRQRQSGYSASSTSIDRNHAFAWSALWYWSTDTYTGRYWSLRCGCPDSDPEHAAEFGQGLSDTVAISIEFGHDR